MIKINLTQNEFEEHLKEQIEFLKSSCESFDNGTLAEAKRIALTIRILYHDTKNSKSLLSQLNRIQNMFCTSYPLVTKSLIPHSGLTTIAARGKESKHYACLDDVPFKRWCPFEEWWNEIVIVDDEQNKLSRKDIILIAADQDGGAHVDPRLTRNYKRLKNENPLNVVYKEHDIQYNIPDALYESIRQIGHEVLRTLIPEYSKKKDIKADFLFATPASVKGPVIHQDIPKMQKFGRNDPCPCGSGKKFKYCHGQY